MVSAADALTTVDDLRIGLAAVRVTSRSFVGG
jgi:hypothetical protein